MKKMISPSMMCADIFALGETLKTFEKNGVSYLHIDIMDGEFVPNFTLGTDYCRLMKKATSIPLDIHLMINDPEKKLSWFDFGEGDIVSVDVGAYIGGFHGDTANTFSVGNVSPEAMKLIEVTRASLEEAMKLLKGGVRLGDIGSCIETYVQQFGYSPVKDFVGHGIGRALHEDPNIPNFGRAGHGLRLPKGATVAIEPMINEGTDRVIVSNEDGWTVTTADGKLSAHYEHTFFIDETCGHILTLPD